MVKMRHYKEVMTEILPKLIQYKIPLHLPQEQLAFGTESLVVSIRVPVPPKIDFRDLKTVSLEPKYITVNAEDISLQLK